MGTGTKEWAEVSLNIARGCDHNCRYCYARYNLVNRFKIIPPAAWPTCRVKKKAVEARYGTMAGTVMFPTSHDILPSILDDYCVVLKKLLESNNRVLVVTKPHYECIDRITQEFVNYKKQILFRFTIGSDVEPVLAFWEPYAPTFEERRRCLVMAFLRGYETSISCEPFLDEHTLRLYGQCRHYITESFWVGKLRHWRSRVMAEDATEDDVRRFVNPLSALCQREYLQCLYDSMKTYPRVLWKDSIREELNL